MFLSISEFKIVKTFKYISLKIKNTKHLKDI